MAEHRKPEEVLDFLNEYFTLMVDCISRTGGIVDKFIGDGIMAHWGALEVHPNNTERAVTAALLMRAALHEYNKKPVTASGREKPQLQIGIGINTGPVIAGQIGSNERLEFTLIGDVVNVAARVESATKDAGADILLSQDSYLQVGDIFKVVPIDPVRLKGKSDEFVLTAVLGRRDDPDCPKSLEDIRRLTGTQK